MIEKKTIIDRIEIDRDGAISIRFGLLLVDGGIEIDCKWHRTAVEPGGDIDAQLAAVDAHLSSAGKATVDRNGIDRLKDVAALVHTPDTVKKFKDARRHDVG